MAYWAEEPGSPVPPARRGRVCSRCIHEISLLALPFTCHSRRRAVAPPVASSAGLRRAAVVAPFYQSLVPRPSRPKTVLVRPNSARSTSRPAAVIGQAAARPNQLAAPREPSTTPATGEASAPVCRWQFSCW